MFSGEEIRVAMARQNLTINEVAERSGIHRTTVSLIINDRHGDVRLETLQKIAGAVGLTAEVVFAPALPAAEVAA